MSACPVARSAIVLLFHSLAIHWYTSVVLDVIMLAFTQLPSSLEVLLLYHSLHSFLLCRFPLDQHRTAIQEFALPLVSTSYRLQQGSHSLQVRRSMQSVYLPPAVPSVSIFYTTPSVHYIASFPRWVIPCA